MQCIRPRRPHLALRVLRLEAIADRRLIDVLLTVLAIPASPPSLDKVETSLERIVTATSDKSKPLLNLNGPPDDEEHLLSPKKKKKKRRKKKVAVHSNGPDLEIKEAPN